MKPAYKVENGILYYQYMTKSFLPCQCPFKNNMSCGLWCPHFNLEDKPQPKQPVVVLSCGGALRTFTP